MTESLFFIVTISLLVWHFLCDHYLLPGMVESSKHKIYAFRDEVRMARIDGKISQQDSEMLQTLFGNILDLELYRIGPFSLLRMLGQNLRQADTKVVVEHLQNSFSENAKEIYYKGIMMSSLILCFNLIAWAPYLAFASIIIYPVSIIAKFSIRTFTETILAVSSKKESNSGNVATA